MSNASVLLPDTQPWVVIDYSPASSNVYLGSPSIAILPGGAYVASHDLFGPGTNEFSKGLTRIYRSDDRGASWRQIAQASPAFWSGLFVSGGQLYLLGTTHHHGDLAVRRSADGGYTWTEPQDAESGLITERAQFHTAPVPVVVHHGRLWRAVESADHGTTWPARYSPRMLSIPVGADPLHRIHWQMSDALPNDRNWLSGTFKGWLEGNAVATRADGVGDLLRVDCMQGEVAAFVHVSDDGRKLSFDPEQDFIKMPGGATKFTIRQDPLDGCYWALVNNVTTFDPAVPAASERNVLSLARSENLMEWRIRKVLLSHPDRMTNAFQYADWVFDGDDLVAAIRTACEFDGAKARSPHDANLLTFHRFTNFRAF